MTLCIGIQVEEGLLALADTKIVKGEEQIIRGKLSDSSVEGSHWWLMTSGLRSVRDPLILGATGVHRDPPPACCSARQNRRPLPILR